ncbi:hypothetical protein DLAC_02810 [Tieghemostelium lacteum]|uniref:Rab3-GAP regulatory subunit N-terminal domain-containing protein n=1 Tax=Tieghemostelium lacteum TaxID=361077 RepID=A0A152A3T4_TIELA|nr:hypothetical protein DLAC_02810 [Tieghemostelium lacteum]|eukprot:KYR00767.1 hypothetical protein DLAC_02810 [Tieghemostelium lacteum]
MSSSEFKLDSRGSLDLNHIKLILGHTNDNEGLYNDSNGSSVEEDKTGSPLATSPKDENQWLSRMSMDLTSDSQFMVIGGGDIGNGLAILMQRRDNNTWKTLITLDHQYNQPKPDIITQILFVPIGLLNVKYVIAIGYQSGYLRIFTTQGNLLLSQIFYNKPILKIKLKNTPVIPSPLEDSPSQREIPEHYLTQELLILYPDNIVSSISGVNLITILQVCYNQISKGEHQNSSSLSFRKWTLSQSAEKVNDMLVCGPFLGSPFRALPYSSTEQSITRLVAVGREPMISIYYPSEDNASSFSVAISSVASKLTTAVYSYAKNWWSGGNKQQTSSTNSGGNSPPLPQFEQPVALSQRWSLADPKREIQSITADPSGRYSVTTDNLGRILLFDLVNSLIVKIWKGYRDSQCGFINTQTDLNRSKNDDNNNEDDVEFEDHVFKSDNEEEEEEEQEEIEDLIPKNFLKKSINSSNNRKSVVSKTHLVIYNGRRGILEIWGLRHQSREFFKNVGKGCKLISTTIPSVNATECIVNDRFQSSKCLSKCFILNPKGNILELKNL